MSEVTVESHSATAWPDGRASARDWMAIIAGALGALMAVLDISITNSALPTIQGSVGATGTEGTWIGSGYLMAESVMIPLSAWLVRVFGMRNFLIGIAVLFSMFSALCGMSDSLTMLVVARIGQGLTGGAMIPTAQTIVRTRLPTSQFNLGMTIFGLTVMLGPIFGPLVGGWLTTHLSWHWCFFINLPIGAILVGLLLSSFDRLPVNWEEFANSDWLGMAGMAVWLSTMTLVLEEGQREQWFESTMIVWLTVVSACGFIVLMLAQRRAARPVIRMSLLRNPIFASVVFLVMVVGIMSYGTSYVIPQFLGLIAQYNAQDSGFVMLFTALPALVLMPVLPRLLARFDMRLMIISGLLFFIAGAAISTGMTTDSAGSGFIPALLLIGSGQLLSAMPLNRASMAFVSFSEASEAAGLYSMARNLGGSIGLAVTGTIMDRREAMHLHALGDSVTANSPLMQDHMREASMGLLTQAGDAIAASGAAMAQLAGTMRLQALVMTFNDLFYLATIGVALCIPLTFILKTPKRQPSAQVVEAH